MATSNPYSYSTDERVNSVDTLVSGGRALLKSSGDIMTAIAMSQNASLALSLQCNRDLKRMVKLQSRGSVRSPGVIGPTKQNDQFNRNGHDQSENRPGLVRIVK